MKDTTDLVAPFPWFGGKRRAAAAAWAAMGNPDCYVEPFGGSAAVLLQRPGGAGKVETYNDLDGLLVNAWRGMAQDPDGVARACDWPVSEIDLEARHLVLVERRSELTARLVADPQWFDVELAGWWIWGACAWIGSGWCAGRGPWRRGADGLLVRSGDAGQGINRQLPHLGDAGQGINRQLPHLGNAGQGINRQLPHLGDAGRGINRQLPHLGDAGAAIAAAMRELSGRLRRVRITCGDWRRVTGPSVVERHGSAAVFLDPPYPEGWSTDAAYSAQEEDALDMFDDVKAVALDLDQRGVRVVLCGYRGTWQPPDGWTERPWKARGGYARNDDKHREVLWCSPRCLEARQASLF